MKRIAKRLAVLGSLAVVAGLVLSAGPASAAGTVSGTCGVQGSATVSPAVKIGPNSGTYQFQDLLFACEGTLNGQMDVATFDVTTAGNYNNTQCGTGSATSTSSSAVVTQSVAGNNGVSVPSAPYSIAFQDGVGTLTFSSPASGSGVVDIIPTGPQAPPIGNTDPNSWNCTSSFNVVGEVSLSAPTA
jgi:hypothetical protein